MSYYLNRTIRLKILRTDYIDHKRYEEGEEHEFPCYQAYALVALGLCDYATPEDAPPGTEYWESGHVDVYCPGEEPYRQNNTTNERTPIPEEDLDKTLAARVRPKS